MTREEFDQYAIDNDLIVWSKEMSEKAIKALEQESKTDITEIRNLLTELIDMIDNGSQRDLDRADEIAKIIVKALEQESCEPVRNPDKLDCISRQLVFDEEQEQIDFVSSHKRMSVFLRVNEDCISRQAVLEIVEREHNKGDALSEIEKLPSTIPEPLEMTGEWVPVPSETSGGWITSRT